MKHLLLLWAGLSLVLGVLFAVMGAYYPALIEVGFAGILGIFFTKNPGDRNE